MSLLFTCSVDGGHPADLRVSDLLAKHEVRATFFIPPRRRAGQPFFTRQQMRELGQRFELGSLARSERPLTELSAREAGSDIFDSKRRLEDHLGRAVSGFAYPKGAYRQREIDLVKACGFRYARNLTTLRIDAGSTPFEMPVTMQFYPHFRGVYLCSFLGHGGWPQRCAGLRLALRHVGWMERLHAMLNLARLKEGVFHLHLKSAELEALALWAALDGFLACAAACTPPGNRLDNEQLFLR
ncbi:Polysaccharide deacetylase [Noviherbaspirillum humi]|uniref:Polysaccharide deacetylase n=1 Tax=Noviherbaspirillum humi TaxID=1688639 RepID=A0A239ECG5_9BURK|nr:polysaccharide deacetylase family protein [Noviherbaspirillum humi]SNS41948.1 Polysaccharide deacetylase [Noviherbaspirillum humi]